MTDKHVAQIGGTHYQSDLQHWDVMEAHDIAYLEGNGTAYLVRYDRKGSPVADLEKAISYFEKMLKYRPEPRRRLTTTALMEFVDANKLDEWKHHMLACTIGPSANRSSILWAIDAMKIKAEVLRDHVA